MVEISLPNLIDWWPSEIEIMITLDSTYSTSIFLPLVNDGRPIVAFGTIMGREELNKVEPVNIYRYFLGSLRLLTGDSAWPHLDTYSAVWLHGTILAFTRKYSLNYSIQFTLTSVFHCLCDAFEQKTLSPLLLLVAIGHAVGTMDATKLRGRHLFLEMRALESLWIIPREVMRVSLMDRQRRATGQKEALSGLPMYSILSSLASRTALVYLCEEDISSINLLPSFASLSGAALLLNNLCAKQQAVRATISTPATPAKW